MAKSTKGIGITEGISLGSNFPIQPVKPIIIKPIQVANLQKSKKIQHHIGI